MEIVQRLYRRLPATEIGRRIGRPARQVRAKARGMGLSIPQRIKAADFVGFLMRKNAEGWSDCEIARARAVDRHAVSHMRKGLGLPSNARSPRVRDRVRATTRAQLRRAGVPTLAALRVKVFRDRARAAGWPEDLRPRAVQILNLLWAKGPQTRRQIADAIGMPWKGSRASLSSNDPEGSYLAHLMKRRLVMCLGRVATRTGRGRSVCMYSLPLGIERKEPDVQTA